MPLDKGTIQILRKQLGWVGGSWQMLTFAYKVGGWVVANAYVSKMEKVNTTVRQIVNALIEP